MIPTPQEFPEIDCRVPLRPDYDRVFATRAFEPFSEKATALLECLSERLLKDAAAKEYPDVISCAFWCRKGSLRAMRKDYPTGQLRLGRGVVFHITPSNVPVNFIYSLAAGLLSGNANIVRIPSRNFRQVEIICSVLRELLDREEFSSLRDHVLLLRYEKNDAITDYFSAHCDVRVIWGGDRTIADIRRSPLPPRSFDVTFADRYSFCVINADAYPGGTDPARIAEAFFNDAYLFDQNACTAPHLLVWLGAAANVKKAQDVFWNSLHKVVAEKYELQSISAVDKLTDAYRYAALFGGGRLQKMPDNQIVRIRLEQLKEGLENQRSACGFFYEYVAKELLEIAPLINRKFQTLAYWGLDCAALRRFIEENRPTGIDRIVPIGRTLDFSLVWDGYDLIGKLSRVVSIIL